MGSSSTANESKSEEVEGMARHCSDLEDLLDDDNDDDDDASLHDVMDFFEDIPVDSAESDVLLPRLSAESE